MTTAAKMKEKQDEERKQMEKMKAKSNYKNTLSYQQQQIDLKNMTKEQKKIEELRFSTHLKNAVQEGDMKDKEK